MKRVHLFIGVALLIGACGTPDSADPVAAPTSQPATTTTTVAAVESTTTTIEESTGFPVSITDGMGEFTIESQPVAIVSISPSSTEILFAIGAGDQVLAVDSLSNFPSEAPLDPDLSAWTPNVEAIIGMAPDLVVTSGTSEDVVAGLAAAGIPVLTHFAPSTIDDVYAQIEQMGAVTGNLDGAALVVATMQSEVDAIVASMPDFVRAPTYYHELDDTLYSVTSATFIGQVYALLGLVNVADPADDGTAYGYPQLSAEYLVDVNPDFIFLADTKCCGVTADSLAERDGWETLDAVASSRIVELDDDVASRWGPRIVDLLRTVADAVGQAELVDG